MTKIVLENKKKEFEDKVMADCTFIPKVGASIDSASFASSRNNRIEELAEPKSVNDKRFNLEHSKLEESLRRPDIQANRTPSSATPSSSAFFQATKRAKDASAIADEIMKVVAAADLDQGSGKHIQTMLRTSDLDDSSATKGDNLLTSRIYDEEDRNAQGKKTGRFLALEEEPLNVAQPPATPESELFNHSRDGHREASPPPNTDISTDSNVTPLKDRKSTAELQEDFEDWKKEMERKMTTFVGKEERNT